MIFINCLLFWQISALDLESINVKFLFYKRKLLTGTADCHSPECVILDDVLIQFGPPDDEYLLLETCRDVK
jgi:hypothetical protein